MINNSIQWFPGHMHKAIQEIEKALPSIDVFIEVLDARIPFSSENPHLKKIRKDKPVLKVLNKRDLADPELTKQWITHLEQMPGVQAVAVTTSKPREVHDLLLLCQQLVPHRVAVGKNVRTMIVGIPNVGKSTIINTLAGRVVAKTGNQPAITRQQQRINLQNGVVLSDTPGVLWPKVENPHSGFRLAATGAIKDTAMEHQEVAAYLVNYLAAEYPALLQSRYQLADDLQGDQEWLSAIAKKRGCLRQGGVVDLHKAGEILLNDLRTGVLGAITLEKPSMIDAELEGARLAAEQKAQEKAENKEARRKRYLKNR
ncbi:MAG: ribosome biogenesis GTPase YlqF [Enterovibrio sp.]